MIPITAYLKQFGSHNNSIRVSGKATDVGARWKPRSTKLACVAGPAP